MVDKTIEILSNIAPVYGAMGAIAAGAGLRFSEILGLTPSRIRLDNEDMLSVIVDQRMNQAGTQFVPGEGTHVLRGGTKSNTMNAGAVKLVTREAVMIDRWAGVVSSFLDDVDDEVLCFKTPNGSNISRTNFSRSVWKKMLVQLEEWAQANGEQVPAKYTMHKLRHWYASELHAQGVTPVEAGRNLGHTKVSTTIDLYTSARQGDKYATAAKLRNVGDDIYEADVIPIAR